MCFSEKCYMFVHLIIDAHTYQESTNMVTSTISKMRADLSEKEFETNRARLINHTIVHFNDIYHSAGAICSQLVAHLNEEKHATSGMDEEIDRIKSVRYDDMTELLDAMVQISPWYHVTSHE